jgi:hypothetical protein
MAFGFFHNIYEQTISAFSKAGKTFRDAARHFKKLRPTKEQAFTAVRRYRENKMFKRAEPFIAEMPRDIKPTEAFFTPTTLMLKARHQYLFNVKFRFTDRPLDEYSYLSFVTDEVLTKSEAEKRMGAILLAERNKEKYPRLKTIEMSLRGTRTTPWLP